jgi:adenylate cyclase
MTLRKLIAGLVLGIGAALIILGLDASGWLTPLESKTYDWRMRAAVSTPPAVNRDIVLVEINDTTIHDLAPFFGRWPWPRLAMATLVDFLNRAPAKVIAIDVTYLEPQRHVSFRIGDDGPEFTGEKSDAMLAEAIRAKGNVILLADAVYLGTTGGEQANAPAAWTGSPYKPGPAVEEIPLVVPPFQSLTDAAAALGHNFLALDPDGPARRMPPFVRVGDKYLPSLGVAAALMAERVPAADVAIQGEALRIGTRVMPLLPTRVEAANDPGRVHDQQSVLINYRAPALIDGARPYTSYEARYLFQAEDQIQRGEKPDLDPAVFRDKIVFVGLTGASGLVDVFQTPFGKQLMPGIQLHASVADSILSNRFLRPAAGGTGVVAVAVGALLVCLMTVALPYTVALAGAILAMAAWTAWALHAFKAGLWLPMAGPLAAMGLAAFSGTAYRYFVEDKEKRKVKGLFGRYVSRDVFTQLLDNPELAQLGGRRRTMTVLFSDIRGFTSVTERGNAEELVAQLNEYFSRMVDVVFRHQGTVDKFVGDMVMALFGAPVDDVDHGEHAVGAAVEMVRELGALNAKWLAEGKPALDIGIGVNSGEMIAGNIGSSSIMSYTVIGDHVNLGSRLESLNKEYRTRIIISDATRALLKHPYDLRPLGDVIVKGKTRPVAIFEVAVPSPIPARNEDAPV